ncbi:MAG: preprotein translocase subunit SecE [bacterium]|nr:preprotein translocase subunit SecE [bacterium]
MTDSTTIAKKASILDFLNSTVLELKKVDWPSREKTTRFTVIVVLVSVAVGLLITGLDLIFTHTIEYILSLKK